MDYSCSNVVNFDKYLVILKKTKLDKVVMKKVNKERWKEREDKQTRKTTNLLTTIEQIEYKVANKFARAWFLASSFTMQ
jgi:hypothetical protein